MSPKEIFSKHGVVMKLARRRPDPVADPAGLRGYVIAAPLEVWDHLKTQERLARYIRTGKIDG